MITVNLYDAAGVLESRHAVPEDQVVGVTMRSRHLVSSGQTFSFGISVVVEPDLPRETLIDARGVVSLEDIRGDSFSLVAYDLPTTRSASDIMREVVQHGVDYPSHGTDCICMDNFIRELRAQVTSSVPAWTAAMDNDRESWDSRMDALMRVRYVVQASVRNL